MKSSDNLITLIAFIIGISVLALSLYSFYTDYSMGRPAINLAIDVIFLMFSAVLVGGSLNLRKRLKGYEVSVNAAFNEVVYSRLKPIMEEVALGIVEMNRVSKKIENLERKISAIEELATTQKLTPEERINFYFKAVVVMVFYIGLFMYMTQYTLPYNYILSALLFIIWWGFITFEFQIFDKGEALVMLIAPVLIIPSLYTLTRTLAGISIAQGMVFIASAFYAYYYYIVAKGITGTGNKGLKDMLGEFRSKITRRQG
ncbi:hypothetical protein [Geoglobus acetivorans]|uniref:Uncharacterized protein n=1 Tax=Geoglobus acetivorans TaxID=565033 RepID=A0A0A7GIZ3_GEOAI|nr:hypothetical protein GACE_1849 [Geoglobus acetivorans]